MTQHSDPSQQAAGDDQDIMHWFATLPPRRTVEPSPQFPRKVMAQIAAQQVRWRWWGWFARLLRPEESPLWLKLTHRIQGWTALLLPQPRWALIGCVAGAVLMAALLATVYLPAHRPGPPARNSVVQSKPTAKLFGWGFGVSEEVIMERTIALSPKLREALFAHKAQATADEHTALLQLLTQESLQGRGEQVATIEIKQGLWAKLQARQDRVNQVKVRLYKDGLLVIDEP